MSNEKNSSEVSENSFTEAAVDSNSNSSSELKICEDDAPLMPIKKQKTRRTRKR